MQAQKNLLIVWLVRVHSSWLLPDLVDDLLYLPDGVDSLPCSCQVWRCLWLPCFYGQTLSRTVPACCTGPPCRKRHKFRRRQNIGTLPPRFHWCLPNYCSQYLCSQASYQKLGKTKSDHHHCPISVHILTTSKSEAVIEIYCWGLWLLKCGVRAGGRGDSLLYLLPPAWQVGEVNRRRLCAQDNVPPLTVLPPLSYKCLFLHLPLSRSKLDGGRWKNPHYMSGTTAIQHFIILHKTAFNSVFSGAHVLQNRYTRKSTSTFTNHHWDHWVG